MAAATNSTSLSTQPAPGIDRGRPSLPSGRRRLLALAAGATAVATTAAHAAATIDEPLESLWHQYQQACERFTNAAEAEWTATDAARAKWPPRPANLYVREHFSGKVTPLDEETLIHWRDQAKAVGLPGSAEVHEKRLAALKVWSDACEAVEHDYGIDQLTERADELSFEMDMLVDRIVETPPRTIRGVAIKLMMVAKVESYTHDGDRDDAVAARTILGLIRDLRAATVGEGNHG